MSPQNSPWGAATHTHGREHTFRPGRDQTRCRSSSEHGRIIGACLAFQGSQAAALRPGLQEGETVWQTLSRSKGCWETKTRPRPHDLISSRHASRPNRSSPPQYGRYAGWGKGCWETEPRPRPPMTSLPPVMPRGLNVSPPPRSAKMGAIHYMSSGSAVRVHITPSLT